MKVVAPAEVAAHSPRPWRAVVRANQIGPRSISVSTDCAQGGVWSVDARTLTAQNVADARLIAAAPDLLAALKAITDACKADCGWEITADCGDDESVGPGPKHDMALTFGMIGRALAAIAKAEGQ